MNGQVLTLPDTYLFDDRTGKGRNGQYFLSSNPAMNAGSNALQVLLKGLLTTGKRKDVFFMHTNVRPRVSFGMVNI
jgi:hypothetical protein